MSVSYKGLEFQTELLARWAAFFDLAGWQWNTNVSPVSNWNPDFLVTFPCGHSECDGSHTLLVSVLPIDTIEALKAHPAIDQPYFVRDRSDRILADGGALFGNSPDATYWDIVHGAGGGVENVHFRVNDAARFWHEAGSLVRSGQ
ncbi:hypothetical protein ABZR34_31190 [Pseudomonas paraeruginosa]|uniref:hypothetical protein n=1 Tax=Pseudomonas paraeruginosa TaxID=2994495 RepID=UPI00345B365C